MNKFLVFFYVLSNLALAGNLSVKLDGQVVSAKACNLKASTKEVWFFIGSKGFAKNGIAQRENKFENNCALKTYNNVSNDLFVKGGEVFASYDQEGKQPIQVNPETVSIPSSSSPVVAPEDPKKELDPEKVKKYAEQSANFFSNRVVDIYGKVENYKYNFYLGFKKASSFYSNLGVSIQNLPQYASGNQNGAMRGYENGYTQGFQSGSNEGAALGKQQAVKRFYNAVQNPQGLDVTVGTVPDGSSYEGSSPSLTTPDLNSKLISFNSDFTSELRTVNDFNSEIESDSDLLLNLYGRDISLGDYYSWNDYKNEILFSYWKGENALDLFLSKKLIKSTSVDSNKVKANNEMVAKYREITDPALYKNAEENRRIFKTTFINQYNDVIGNKWNSEVYRKPNYEAQSRGEFYFTKALQAYAYDVGFNNGYIRSYGPRNAQGYQKAIGPAYISSFNNTVSYYSTNPVLEELSLDLLNQDGKNTFSIIDSVYLVLNQVANYGRVPGKLVVSAQPNKTLENSSSSFEIEIPGLTRLSGTRELGLLAQVSPLALPDQEVSLSLNTSVGIKTIVLKVSWHQTIQQIAHDTKQRVPILVQYISQQLGTEMKNMKSLFKKNKYKTEPQNTLAGKFVTSYLALSSEEKQVLNQFQTAILSEIGKRPSSFICIGCGKDEWDSAQYIFKQIGWSLPK